MIGYFSRTFQKSGPVVKLRKPTVFYAVQKVALLPAKFTDFKAVIESV